MLERLKAGTPIGPYETIRIDESGKAAQCRGDHVAAPRRARAGWSASPRSSVISPSNKRAEEALSTVSRRLIDAQEQERSRIARELHDDIGQRLALLAVNLAGLTDGGPSSLDSTAAWRGCSGRPRKSPPTFRRLSHRLHSSRLDLLGITAAAKHLCDEFAEQQNAAVDFDSRDLPERLPRDISLCLFRILQEALHNAAKHSGVRQFEVRLWNAQGQVHLLVRDRGKGLRRGGGAGRPWAGPASAWKSESSW